MAEALIDGISDIRSATSLVLISALKNRSVKLIREFPHCTVQKPLASHLMRFYAQRERGGPHGKTHQRPFQSQIAGTHKIRQSDTRP